MLTCRQYIFKLTSGQLQEAGMPDRLRAWLHLRICHRCRSFTGNDQQLDHLLDDYRNNLQALPAARSGKTPAP